MIIRENILIQKLCDDAIVPTRGSAKAAGLDLYAHLEEVEQAILPHETVKIHTGIAAAIPEGCAGLIFARSGLATKDGLRPANAVGVIDEDYRGEIIVALHNDSDQTRYIFNKDRIAQLVVVPYVVPHIQVVDKLQTTERGEGGFGSTGK